jgi:hypothetical protein
MCLAYLVLNLSIRPAVSISLFYQCKRVRSSRDLHFTTGYSTPSTVIVSLVSAVDLVIKTSSFDMSLKQTNL